MNKKIITALTLILILNITLVMAVGVGNPYSGRILTVEKGTTTIVNISLQNMVGDADYTMSAQITEGSGLASFDKESYFLKAKTSNTMAQLKITIPENYVNPSGRIMMEFKVISSGEGGGLEQGVSYRELIQLSIVESPPKEMPKITTVIITFLIITIIAIILIILVLMRAKKR